MENLPESIAFGKGHVENSIAEAMPPKQHTKPTTPNATHDHSTHCERSLEKPASQTSQSFPDVNWIYELDTGHSWGLANHFMSWLERRWPKVRSRIMAARRRKIKAPPVSWADRSQPKEVD